MRLCVVFLSFLLIFKTEYDTKVLEGKSIKTENVDPHICLFLNDCYLTANKCLLCKCKEMLFADFGIFH